jgi:hypothetical protein
LADWNYNYCKGFIPAVPENEKGVKISWFPVFSVCISEVICITEL